MTIHAKAIEMWPINKLKQWPGNPRRGDLDRIVTSIEVNGFYAPVIVQKSSGYIIAGNHRTQAAESLKYPELPVVVVDVDDETARRMVLADNKTSDSGSYNTDDLVEMLGQFDLDDLAGTGWSAEEVEKLLEPPIFDDEPDAGEQMGDLQFRLVVDCTSEQHQATLLSKLEAEGLIVRPLVS